MGAGKTGYEWVYQGGKGGGPLRLWIWSLREWGSSEGGGAQAPYGSVTEGPICFGQWRASACRSTYTPVVQVALLLRANGR